MKKQILFLLIIAGSFLFASCEREDAKNLNFDVTVDRTVIKVGEKINFRIAHNAERLTVYPGIEGEDYRYSLDYLLRGISEEDINAGNFNRVENPQSYIYNYSINNLEVGDPLNDIYVYDNAQPQTQQTKNFIGLPLVCSIKQDVQTGDNVIAFKNIQGKSFMNYYIRFYPKIPVASNKTLTFRMRGETNTMYVKEAGLYKPYPADAEKYINFYIRLSCKLKNGEEVSLAWADAPNGLSNTASICQYVPSVEYQDVSFDLSNHIRNWCSNNNVYESDIDCVSYIEFNIKEQNARAYFDELYISNISFGGISYIDYNKGTTLPIYNGSGIQEYSYQYDQPGTYEVTFVAANYSYKQDFSEIGNESSKNYNFKQEHITIPIKVIK